MNCLDELKQFAGEFNLQNMDSKLFAIEMDKIDPLKQYRSEFHFPNYEEIIKAVYPDLIHTATTTTTTNNNELDNQTDNQINSHHKIIYFCGHSMGLQPKKLKFHLNELLEQWANLGVLSYHYGKLPASKCDLKINEQFANLFLNSKSTEVTLTNNLSVNMHLLIAKFYKPCKDKKLILIEENIFPSDFYVLESQLNWNSLDPKQCLIKLKPRANEYYLRNEDILKTIISYKDCLALIWLPGIQFITGQLFDIKTITNYGHKYANCPVGWDLAHAIGNVPLYLHEWEVDFAVWCSYKYLNASPGAIGGLFVHEKHHHTFGTYGPRTIQNDTTTTTTTTNNNNNNNNTTNNNNNNTNNTTTNNNLVYGPQLTGWWSHRDETRFNMTCEMELAHGAQAYRISNPSLLLIGSLKVSLDLFKSVGNMNIIRQKSIKLTAYLEYMINKLLPKNKIQIITPENINERGAQLTINVDIQMNIEYFYMKLIQNGLICDLRKPKFIRISPIPLYNSFTDVYEFVQTFKQILEEIEN